jgi:hypothetical protein
MTAADSMAIINFLAISSFIIDQSVYDKEVAGGMHNIGVLSTFKIMRVLRWLKASRYSMDFQVGFYHKRSVKSQYKRGSDGNESR